MDDSKIEIRNKRRPSVRVARAHVQVAVELIGLILVNLDGNPDDLSHGGDTSHCRKGSLLCCPGHECDICQPSATGTEKRNRRRDETEAAVLAMLVEKTADRRPPLQENGRRSHREPGTCRKITHDGLRADADGQGARAHKKLLPVPHLKTPERRANRDTAGLIENSRVRGNERPIIFIEKHGAGL